MFGNSELKETKQKLDIAINIATEIFTGMDPVIRPLYLKKYKSMIDYYDRLRGSYTFTSDISNDRDRKHVEENKEVITVLREVVKKVESALAEEEYEGSSYTKGLGIPVEISRDPNSHYNKLLKFLNESFPGLYQKDEKDKQETIGSEDSYVDEIEDEEEYEEKKNGKFGTPNYPTDIKAYYQAIFYLLMSRQVELNQKGTPMSNATRLSIQLICDYVTPDDTSANDKFSPDLLLSFKREIQGITGFIKWMDSKIPQNLDRLKIGEAENDLYKTQQDFINDIDPNEIIDIIRNAWIESKDLEKMPKIKLFEKDIKEKWDDWE